MSLVTCSWTVFCFSFSMSLVFRIRFEAAQLLEICCIRTEHGYRKCVIFRSIGVSIPRNYLQQVYSVWIDAILNGTHSVFQTKITNFCAINSLLRTVNCAQNHPFLSEFSSIFVCPLAIVIFHIKLPSFTINSITSEHSEHERTLHEHKIISNVIMKYPIKINLLIFKILIIGV